MALPNVNVNILSTGLGVSNGANSDTPLEVGWATQGSVDTIIAFTDTPTIVATFGSGPLVDQLALDIAVGGGTVYGCRIYSGTIGSVTHVGAGTGTITITGNPTFTGALKILISTASGVSTAGFFQFSTNGGATYSVAQTIPVTPFQVSPPNTGLTFTFSAQVGTGVWVLNDTYAFPNAIISGTVGAVTQTTVAGAGGPGHGTVTPSGTPVDAYNVVVKITQSGTIAAGTSVFVYSLDGGNTFSNPITMGTSFVVGSTGITLTFADVSSPQWVIGDQYSFATTQPAFTTTDVVNCMAILTQSPLTWGWVHIVGKPASIAGAASLASTMDTIMTAAAAQGRYAFAIIETPTDTFQANIDAALIAGFASFSTQWVMVCAGDVATISPATGTQISRNSAFLASARLCTTPIGEDLGRVASGPIVGASVLYRDERQQGGILDAVGFTTIMTLFGITGFYFAAGRIMAPNTSAFQLIQYRRVMNVAAGTARAAALNFLNNSVRVNATTGFIFEADAQRIERYIQAALNTAIVANGAASQATVTVNRSHNILADQTLPITISVVPLGYSKIINETIGFVNPQLSIVTL